MSTGESDGFCSFLPDDASAWRSEIPLRLCWRYWIALCDMEMSATRSVIAVPSP